jgi:16S rRNA (uracil1498-N3)-methyltransferase
MVMTDHSDHHYPAADRRKRHRFIGGFRRVGSTVKIEDQQLLHQIGRVLKLAPGEEVIFCTADGQELVACLDESRREAEILNLQPGWQPAVRVTLYLAMAKRDHFELACRQATECGVARIVPVVSRRTVKNTLNLDRTRSILKEAAEQSGRCQVPELADPQPLETVWRELPPSAFIMDPGGASSLPVAGAEIAVLIGPEGGWGVSELEAAVAAGCRPFSLGPLVLRTETAAAVAVWRMQAFQ